MRSAGLQFVHYDYIGGVQLDTGSMYFYSVDLLAPEPARALSILFSRPMPMARSSDD